MQLDDLIGLLFFVFFVILPALSGLLRRGQGPPDLDEPELPRPQPPQRPQPTAQPAPQPQPRPAQPTPRPQPRPVQTPRAGGEVARAKEYARPAQPPAPAAPQKATPQLLLTDKDAILKGVIWRQILEEPRGKHWRRSLSAGRRRRRPST